MMTADELNKKAMQDNTVEAIHCTDTVFDTMVATVLALPLIRSYIQRGEVEKWSLAMKNAIKKNVVEAMKTELLFIIATSTKQWQYGEKALKMGMSGRVPRRVLREAMKRGLFSHREDAMKKFINRKTNGLTLSQRVWNLIPDIQAQIEQTVQVGILEGESATEIAKNLKQYLREPDKLFRRVRDAQGELHLSKSAQDYHSGTGVYRSSQKNAERLARNEINKAYRTAQWEQMQSLDFVVGYQIKRSGSAKYPCDLCDTLCGKYPKSFKWSGWHVGCLCFAVPILKTSDEFFEYDGREATTTESVNEVKEIPTDLKQWLKSNKKRYVSGRVDWIDDNPEALKIIKKS